MFFDRPLIAISRVLVTDSFGNHYWITAFVTVAWRHFNARLLAKRCGDRPRQLEGGYG